MNKQEFISLIEHPETLGKKNSLALKNIATDFPYFQTAQLLLTKALHNEKHYEFEKQLKYSALMVPDRSVLYNYIFEASKVESSQSENNIELIDTAIGISEVEVPHSLQVNENLVVPEPIEETIEKPVLQKTVESLVDTAIESILEPTVTFETPTEEAPIEPFKVDPLETLIPDEIIERNPTETVEAVNEANPAPISTNEEHSFTEWLKVISNSSHPILDIPVLKTEKNQTLTSSILETPNLKPQPSNVPEFESVLDKFIRENPRMSRPKAEFYSPVNMAKQSVAENDEFVTETLANVYYKQGHLKKAIKAYEKLCLIYPHKMSYFAGLIQKIKTENKD